MHIKPQLKFFLSGLDEPIDPKSRLWNRQIPTLSVTYGGYFEAAGYFITKNNCEVLLTALSFLNEPKRPAEAPPINEIKISLEKHGAFYHPSRVEVAVVNSVFSFVLNAAASKPGIEWLRREYLTLQKLNSLFSNSFIPAVFGQDLFDCGNKIQIGMFLGGWFERYNEFHISKDPSDGKEKILMWDDLNGNRFISGDMAVEIYRQASMIMTCFYDVHTFEQIFPWHHAAGDFVVKQTGDSLDVKLITARQYASLFEPEVQTKDRGLIYEGLLMFLTVLSIRMRLDRIDGAGDIVWADKISVEGTITGFREGIKIKTDSNVVPPGFLDEFRAYVKSISGDELLELFRAVADSFNQSAPDMPVIRRNLTEHSGELFHALKNL